MGMYEIEDAVEAAIRLLDNCDLPTSNMKTLLFNLYAFQSQFDTGYTQFRVMDILLKHHYVYKITLDKYPDFEAYKKYLEPPQEQWILKYPDKEWDEDENPGVAFYNAEEKCVYFEAGSHPWESLVASNHLSGSDAVPPAQMRFEEIALQVFKAAEQKRDPATMKMWLPLIPMYYTWTDDQPDFLKLKNNESIQKIQKLFSTIANENSQDPLDYSPPLPTYDDFLELDNEMLNMSEETFEAYKTFCIWWYNWE